MPRSRRSRGLLQPADGVAGGPRERRLVIGGRERERTLPPVVPAIAGPSATDLAGPGVVHAASLAFSGSRPRRSRASRARPGRDDVRPSAGRPLPVSTPIRQVIRSALSRPEISPSGSRSGRPRHDRWPWHRRPSRIRSRLRGVPKRWYAGSQDPIHEDGGLARPIDPPEVR
jgi:hypothetical protein